MVTPGLNKQLKLLAGVYFGAPQFTHSLLCCTMYNGAILTADISVANKQIFE